MRECGVRHESNLRPIAAYASEAEATTVRNLLVRLIREHSRAVQTAVRPPLDALKSEYDEKARKVGDENGLASDYDLVEVPLQGAP